MHAPLRLPTLKTVNFPSSIKDFLCKVYIELLLSIRIRPNHGKFFGLPEQNFSYRRSITNPTDWDA